MKKVVTLKDNVKTFARPSVNSIVVNEYSKSGKELIVYPSVDDWYELRPVDVDGVFNTEFVQKIDVLERPAKKEDIQPVKQTTAAPAQQKKYKSQEQMYKKVLKKLFAGGK
ncbi:hypothetical protein V7200_10630 [Cytobacillus firmus]|uniref:Uncharacterized protein n=1 Tax=Cytobacillus firmus TaxID=1399 RepID=A0A800MYX7_CYTFI|nr:hypothetical protein [Cytobacillus firmus]KAF0824999.1 hypothetical protein KIS1582_1201 [Cytobacillus firmus]